VKISRSGGPTHQTNSERGGILTPSVANTPRIVELIPLPGSVSVPSRSNITAANLLIY
jgi:hypothetical protein